MRDPEGVHSAERGAPYGRSSLQPQLRVQLGMACCLGAPGVPHDRPSLVGGFTTMMVAGAISCPGIMMLLN